MRSTRSGPRNAGVHVCVNSPLYRRILCANMYHPANKQGDLDLLHFAADRGLQFRKLEENMLADGWGASMTNYRVFFLGEDGHIKGNKLIECDSDAEAMALAEQECPDHTGLEVWQSTRMVGQIDARRG
jgi:hypothetical protein